MPTQASPVCRYWGIHPECRIRYRTKRIGDQHFLAQTVTETLDAGCKPPKRVTTPENLFGDVMETDNRTRDQLRKHGDVNAHVERIAQCACLAAIDVDEVRHRVKSEKRYADRQPRRMELRSSVFQARHMGEHAGGKKTGVLEICQDDQVERDAQRQHHLLARRIREARHQQADQPVHGDRTDHQKHVNGLAPRIEYQTGEQQQCVPHTHRAEVIQPEHAGQKEKQESRRTENHRSPLHECRCPATGQRKFDESP